MNVNPNRIPFRRFAPVVGVAVPLLVPIILFQVAGGFQLSLTLILAPLAGLCLFVAPPLLRNLFLACLGAGAASIVLAAIVLADQFQVRYILSLLLIMTPPLYFFLGSYLCAHYFRFELLLIILALVATVFVITLAIEPIATGTQVRWYVGAQGYTVLNVDFLGLPLYGSFGVLSLTDLIVLQLFTIGAAFFAVTRGWLQPLLLTGFAAATFLVTGSNARGPQLVLPFLIVVLGLVAVLGRRAVRLRAGALLLLGAVSVGYSAVRMVEPLRIVTTVRELLNLPVAAEGASTIRSISKRGQARASFGDGSATDRAPIDLESLSTGRESLLRDALAEVRLSPIFGNGFASFGRVDRNVGSRSVQSGNRTTHVQYLTVLWKGGVLFFVPYAALVGAFWLRAIRGSLGKRRDDVLFLDAGLVFLFTILSITWDILLVPSAGAFGFFLLGAVSESSRSGPGTDIGRSQVNYGQ